MSNLRRILLWQEVFRDCGFYGFQNERTTSNPGNDSILRKIRNLPETVVREKEAEKENKNEMIEKHHA